MLFCVNVETMRQSDAYTIKHFVPSLTLMHRAAMGVFKASGWDGRTAIAVGSGNNGGDGFALACILKRVGHNCTVFTLSARLSGDSAHYAREARELGVPIEAYTPGCLTGFDRIVDCLLGTGFRGEVRENYRQCIEEINASPAMVISVDINSGMNGDTGEGSPVVRSDLTITIGFVKDGLITPRAGRYLKRLVCADIGILLVGEKRIITEENAPGWLDLNLIEWEDND